MTTGSGEIEAAQTPTQQHRLKPFDGSPSSSRESVDSPCDDLEGSPSFIHMDFSRLRASQKASATRPRSRVRFLAPLTDEETLNHVILTPRQAYLTNPSGSRDFFGDPIAQDGPGSTGFEQRVALAGVSDAESPPEEDKRGFFGLNIGPKGITFNKTG